MSLGDDIRKKGKIKRETEIKKETRLDLNGK
jgi:hypothetical protein